MDYLLLILITMILSGFFSGMEIAFVSSNKLRIEIDKKRGSLAPGFLSVFTKHPSYYIATMLIGNNIALVVYGILMAKLLNPILQNYFELDSSILTVKTIVSTVIILVFSEFLPKTLFRINPNKILRALSVPTMLFYTIFYPITRFSMAISGVVLRLFFGIKNHNSNDGLVFDRFDLSDLLTDSADDADKQQEFKNDVRIFRNALDFTNIKLKECIVPRNELVAAEINDDIAEVIQKFNDTGFSRLLVYRESIDNIIGYTHTVDMFRKPGSLKNIVHNLPIVPETMSANKLLAMFTSQGKSIALVVDEFGGTAGIVTLEDIIEEIFGEIEDEHDKVELVEKQIEDNVFILSGRHEIDYLNEKFGFHFPDEEDFETLAGLILYYNEDIPTINQVIAVENYRFQILKATGSRIEEVKLWFLPQ
ncbi:MAG: hemolysin family protein [Salinivirgaceae bacterium]